MIPQPKLLDHQFALLMTDGATGHVLTTNGDVYLGDSNEVYLIFNNIPAARDYIVAAQAKDNSLEFSLFNSKYVLEEFWKAPNGLN
jgi:hypothetical protein